MRLSLFDCAIALTQRVAERRDAPVEISQPDLLVLGGGRNQRRGVAVLHCAAPLRDVVDVREELVELFLRERVVLVIVAARAAHGEAQEDGARGFGAVHDVLDRIFFRHDAVLGVAAMVAVETRGDLLVHRRVRQHVPGNLFHREPVERQIPVKRVDHPVAPSPHHALAVKLVAVGVGVARRIQPARRHPFATARRGQETIDGLFVSAGRVVVQKGIDFGGGRRQPGEIKRDPPEQSFAARPRRRAQSLVFQTVEDEIVNGIPWPGGVFDCRERRPLGRNKRPVLLPLGSLGDPETQRLNLRLGQLQAGPGRRHPPGFVRRDPL